MLTSIHIKNFALIEHLSVNFTAGFSTITGETGAGKSILLGALALVLGKRADLNSLKNKDEKCVIEAVFDLNLYDLKTFFEQNDLDYDDTTIIRREIAINGKSRAFVNDSPVSLQILQELSVFLIDIHSQNQTHELTEELVQFRIIDALANQQNEIVAYEHDYQLFKKLKINLANLIEKYKSANKEKDYNSYLLDELIASKIVPGEEVVLESRYKELNSVSELKENLNKILVISEDENLGILQNLKETKNSFQKLSSISDSFLELSERCQSVLIEFDDIILETNHRLDKLVTDPAELELVNQKLLTIDNLQKKHQVQSSQELLDIQNDLEHKLDLVYTFESEIKSLESKLHQIEADLNTKSNQISSNRKKTIPILVDKLGFILEQLGMPNAKFNIQLLPTIDFQSNGKDAIEFLFMANKGSDFGLLKKVASGGEMSRIMLATKAILAEYSKLPTIIFDEIDTGVSGEIANKMASIMKKMSNNMQVFSITHLPQIAAKGDTHFKVFKTTKDDKTSTELIKIEGQNRIVEIAEMLSGKDISESAINHAKVLLLTN